jgi:hypothetical protein
MKISCQLYVLTALTPKDQLGTNFTGGWVVPIAGMNFNFPLEPVEWGRQPLLYLMAFLVLRLYRAETKD